MPVDRGKATYLHNDAIAALRGELVWWLVNATISGVFVTCLHRVATIQKRLVYTVTRLVLIRWWLVNVTIAIRGDRDKNDLFAQWHDCGVAGVFACLHRVTTMQNWLVCIVTRLVFVRWWLVNVTIAVDLVTSLHRVAKLRMLYFVTKRYCVTLRDLITMMTVGPNLWHNRMMEKAWEFEKCHNIRQPILRLVIQNYIIRGLYYIRHRMNKWQNIAVNITLTVNRMKFLNIGCKIIK